MRKITMTLAAAVFVLGSITLASAQTQVPGAASIRAQAQIATSIHKAVCHRWGALRTRTSLSLQPLSLRVCCLLVNTADAARSPPGGPLFTRRTDTSFCER